MKFIFKCTSYIFHPLAMPLFGVLFYFHKTPRFVPEPVQYAKLFSTVLLTIILPLLVYFLLKTLKRVDSIHLKSIEERKLPLLINACIVSLVISRIFPQDEILELFFFFIGILISTLGCFTAALLKIKASIHMLAASGFFAFVLGLSWHFKINLNGSMALMSIILGGIATSRLQLKAHTYPELLYGILLGAIPQFILFQFWL